jgi:pimeloyl-ACP methyl ester carboxylesterase
MTMNKMTYLDTGQGFPVLLVHSYLFDKSMWAPQSSPPWHRIAFGRSF